MDELKSDQLPKNIEAEQALIGAVLANNKTFEITVLNGKVTCEETSKEADSEMNITSFTQLVCGAFTLSEVKLRADVKIKGNENFINNFFTKKPVYIRETF